ncbi:hypothetical protein CC86DRAFT_377849 [Ophiobolus disseminans]|uniref:Uncharacterized protein n=1 Tax=Ophiobolus disseminans TaxID=1469910 RepID=A0A6A7AHF0_9PLEO|nr:hypothetical protein CC86DRAFT_377849 [Ophiobolus disseminans]
MYDPGCASFEDYPRSRGWNLDADRAALENYRHIGENYRDVSMQHSLQSLKRMLDEVPHMSSEEEDVLRYGISIIQQLMSSINTESTSTHVTSACLNTGARILDDAIEESRSPPQTNNKDFAARRLQDFGRLIECEKFSWRPWMFANVEDQTLMEVKDVFGYVQSWLFFGYIFETFWTLGVTPSQSEFVDCTGKLLSTQLLQAHFCRIQNGHCHPAEAEVARLHQSLTLALTTYHEPLVSRHEYMNTRGDGWSLQPLFLSSEVNVCIAAVAEQIQQFFRDAPIRPNTRDSDWVGVKARQMVDTQRYFIAAGSAKHDIGSVPMYIFRGHQIQTLHP